MDGWMDGWMDEFIHSFVAFQEEFCQLPQHRAQSFFSRRVVPCRA